MCITVPLSLAITILTALCNLLAADDLTPFFMLTAEVEVLLHVHINRNPSCNFLDTLRSLPRRNRSSPRKNHALSRYFCAAGTLFLNVFLLHFLRGYQHRIQSLSYSRDEQQANRHSHLHKFPTTSGHASYSLIAITDV
ncbi:hypothetical protein GGU10DRAFT_41153 [Lentinula aff. detonsa]|uniref:Secreted protein n=1 Tax=Lentinula aff. detonsa TaxID=2804958 RepID=A0AA38L3N5_9AGAR|nr:hypothetical protein GGU10DRAFT_41153 [Lentinula aff. detonsa]